ncbi:extracellular solute-binding protein [Salinadaptatus halalkaliphilus]|uniref:Extracellular solute-binding protein n=1 Tax=Salinadaptatus halalkaliphilus TaxID=2419781 RepID=A0A4S3TNC7_9EURY|nr:extracellular solute-binding protein [Salinadaptatus halalkaliphilus]THE64048.1 extracellular solute-binding protein [Salinadaptatus halalkaliphilus]
MRTVSNTRAVSRRRLLQTGVVASGIAITGCLGGTDQTLGYISRGGITQEAERDVMEQWSEESGIEVTHQEAADDTEMLELIAENPEEFDFTNLVPAAFSQHRVFHDEELFAEIDYGEIPNYDNIKDSWQDAPFLQGHDYGTFYYNNSQGIAYNTEHVEPTTWEELKDEEYEDVISLHDNAVSRFANTCAMADIDPAEAVHDDELFDEVFEEMEEFHPNVVTYWAAGDEWMRLLREEQTYAVEGWGGRTENLQDDGLPMEYVIPDEGCLTYSTGFAIVEESDMKDEVYDLLNYFYERENAVELTLGHGYPVQLEDPPEEITNRQDYTDHPDDVLWFDWDQIYPELERIEQRFNELKAQ